MKPGARAALGPASVALVVGAWVSPVRAQALDPTVTIDRTGTAAGEQLLITGAGWPAGAIVVVELCGQGGIHGSVDCDVPHQATAGVGPSGAFSALLTSGTPPAPCPCVVKATDQTSQIAATAAIAVAGVPTVPITQDSADGPLRRLEIGAMRITGGGWTELFGVPSPRTLELTIVNTGAVNVDDPALAVAWGRGHDPTGIVTAPDVGRLEPGQERTVRLRLPRAAFAFGEYTVVVDLQGLGAPVRSEASDRTFPWGLAVLGLIILQLGLVRLRSRLRRRIAGRPVPALPAEAVGEVIDLTAPDVPEDEGLRRDVAVIQEEARSILERAEHASAARVAALAQQVEEARARAAEHEQAAQARLVEAAALVRDAQQRVAEVLLAAETAADGMRRAAAMDRDAARAELEAVQLDGRALLDTGRQEVEELLAELQRCIDALHGPSPGPAHRATGLAALDTDGGDAPDGYEQLDRRLADAVVRALGS